MSDILFRVLDGNGNTIVATWEADPITGLHEALGTCRHLAGKGEHSIHALIIEIANDDVVAKVPAELFPGYSFISPE